MSRSRPASCSGCVLEHKGTDFSQIEGTGSLGVLIVAEASGEMEARDQLPLRPYAPAGSVLQRTFTRMGLDRKQFSITNVLRCRPPNNFLENSPWEFSSLNKCRPNLDAAIAERRPKAIFTLGNVALRELTGEAGEARGISHLMGYVLPGPNKIPVIPSLHPAFIRRGKASMQGVFSRNLQRAINVASGKDHEWIWDLEEGVRDGRIRYQVHPSLDEARSYASRIAEASGVTISYDLETFESASLDEDARDGFTDTKIRLIQFSTGRGEGIAFPWEGEFRNIAARILHSSNTKVTWNGWLFDDKVLRACGEREGIDLRPRGTLHDGLQMFHHWQPDLPAHLQFAAQFVNFEFPWKHLAATDLEFYGCVDVDATLRLYNFLVGMLQRDRIWEGAYEVNGNCNGGYVGQVAAVRPVLAAMEDRGLPVDDVERLKLDGEFKLASEELAQELMSRFPESAKKLDPYKTFPPELKKLLEEEWGKLFREPDKLDKKGRLKAGKWYRYGQREIPEAIVDDANGEPKIQSVLRWCYIPEFNPNSGKQLIEYMKAKGHRVPKSKETDEDGNEKDTTNKKELVRLAARHSDTFYTKTIEYRELTKMRGTYVDGFKPHEDGCTHTTFTFDTGIGQLSSRNPNIQNYPKHGRLAKATRRMIAAKENMVLTEWDYKSCHVITLGFLAEDLNYMRLGRLDIHSFVAGHVLGLWDGFKIFSESDEELRARFKWLKANPEWKHVRDDQAKHAILGIGNGLKEKGLFERYMEEFGNQKTAKRFLDICEGLFPNVFRWQERIQKRAHEQQFLRTEFGHIRRFYEVFRWDHKKGSWGHGDQGEQAISFWLSNIAFGHIRENMKAVHALGLAEKYGMCNNVHDSLMFHFPASLLPEHVHEIYPVLSMPSKVLKHPTIAPDGLWIDLDCSVGKNWSEMEEVALDRSKAGYVKKEAQREAATVSV